MAILPADPEYMALEDFPVNEMSKQPFILSAEGTDYDIHALLEKTRIKPDIRFTSKDDHAIVSMVANHLGVSILPRLVVEDAHYHFVAKPIYPHFSRELGIAYKDNASLSPAARRLIDRIKEMLPEEA